MEAALESGGRSPEPERKIWPAVVLATLLLALLVSAGAHYYKPRAESEKQRELMERVAANQKILNELAPGDIVEQGIDEPLEMAVATATLETMKDLYSKNSIDKFELTLAVLDVVDSISEEKCKELGSPLMQMIQTRLNRIGRKLKGTELTVVKISPKQLKRLREEHLRTTDERDFPHLNVPEFRKSGIVINVYWQDHRDRFVLHMEAELQFKIGAGTDGDETSPDRRGNAVGIPGTARVYIPKRNLLKSQIFCLEEEARAELQDFRTEIREAQVEAGRVVVLDDIPLKRIRTRLSLKVEPEQAKIEIEGAEELSAEARWRRARDEYAEIEIEGAEEETYSDGMYLPMDGDYTLVVSAEGYVQYKEKIVLKDKPENEWAQIFLSPDAELPKSSNISLFRVGNDEIRICSTG